ncbi:MAG: serine hydrolase [Ilumatobacteraceae bacterium]|nr:serine hydrolase [Ilumatobacteraceae bacterium]
MRAAETTEPEPAQTTEPETADTTEPAETTEPEPEPVILDFSEVDAVVSSFVEERGLNGAGLAVVDPAGVVHEQYWGEFDPDRISLVASSSKQLTAGVMLALQDQGLLDVDAPLNEIVGDAWGPGVPEITVAQMVSNSSGLVGLGPDPTYAPYLCQFIGEDLQRCGRTIATTPDDDADVVPSDTEFRYGGAQWQVAGAVAEYVSGKSWDELIQEVYRDPCGLTSSFGYNNHWATLGAGGFGYPPDFDGDLSLLAPTSNPQMEGGAYLTVPDYAALLLMHLRDGACPNGQVLSSESLETMYTDRAAAVWGGDAGDAGIGYGYGWWHDRNTGRISDAGAYGSIPWLDFDGEYGVYLVIEEDSGTGNELKNQIEELIDDVMTA